ncbi:aromatase/cyclase [Streptomyces sp. TP-A0874]|uniref:aromatase/cyclase n=1 Tax=Streptomyces sp. TP-A0874 TaxID=549819 RepID=UPI000853C337|nr:SRPBCC family protein [Streptomyces sp. TP-A0874]
MAQEPVTRARQETKVRAPAAAVYRLLADLDNWPRVFRPFVHLERLGTDGAFERIGMWTTDGEQVEHWVALRRLDERALRIDFRPEEPPASLASMERSWVVEPLSAEDCLLRLEHRYRMAEDDPAARADTGRLTESVGSAELSAVREAAEQQAASPGELLVLNDHLDIAGRARDVYDFLHAARHWDQRLPHVTEVTLHQDDGDGQLVEMATRESGGGLLTTKAARVGRPHREIVYKQLLLPPIGKSHCVRWRIGETAGGTSLAVQQIVVVDGAGVERMLGAGTSTAEAEGFIRRELGTKMRLILDGARRYVEANAA